jgi:hypothetical protein
MSKIIVDQFQTTGGTAFTLPTADGTANQYLSTNAAGVLGWQSQPTPPENTILPDDDYRIIGTILSGSSRENVYSTGEWSSTGPWTTYYNDWEDSTSRIQGINMFMGDGRGASASNTDLFYMNDGTHNEQRKLEFSYGNRVGHHRKDYFEYDNSTGNYSGIHIRALPLRNTTSVNITRNITAYASAKNASYGGSAIHMFTPDSEAYSTTTGGTWTDVDNEASSDSDTNHGAKSIVIPANKTVIVFLTSSTRYETTYRMKSTNMFTDLSTLCPASGDLVCDLRMLNTISQVRVPNSGQQVDSFYNVYPACAALYGDRS